VLYEGSWNSRINNFKVIVAGDITVQVKDARKHIRAHFIAKFSPAIFQVSVMHRILLLRAMYGYLVKYWGNKVTTDGVSS